MKLKIIKCFFMVSLLFMVTAYGQNAGTTQTDSVVIDSVRLNYCRTKYQEADKYLQWIGTLDAQTIANIYLRELKSNIYDWGNAYGLEMQAI